MQSNNKFFDDLSQLMTNAMGVAQGAKDEAQTAMKSMMDRWLADRRRVTQSPRTVLTSQVQTKLDWREGLDAYRRDPAWRKGIIEHFRYNLGMMVRMARNAGVPVILVNPVANLRDCPPFKSEFRSDLTEAEQRRITELRAQARRLGWSDVHRKIELLEQAAEIDDQHAGLLYVLVDSQTDTESELAGVLDANLFPWSGWRHAGAV